MEQTFLANLYCISKDRYTDIYEYIYVCVYRYRNMYIYIYWPSGSVGTIGLMNSLSSEFILRIDRYVARTKIQEEKLNGTSQCVF